MPLGHEGEATKRLIEDEEERLNVRGGRQARPGDDSFDPDLAHYIQRPGTHMYVACVAQIAGGPGCRYGDRHGHSLNGDGTVTAWPYNGAWANWYHGYENHYEPNHPWAGHGWGNDGYMGQLQLAHFVPDPQQDDGYWWFDEWGQAQGVPTKDPEEP